VTMLTPDQQAMAERALEFVAPCLHYFMGNYPCLREVVDREDLESAARLACVMAARTFDPARDPKAYFSRAIMHELLKSCRTEIRSRNGSAFRIQITAIERRLPPEKLEDDATISEILTALHALPSEDREWITESVIEGVSIRKMAKAKGISTRQAAKLLTAKLGKLRREAGLALQSGPSVS